MHGIESPNYTYPTVWVCTGDTLSVDTVDGLTITTIDGFWITCDEITRDVWRWYSYIDRTPAEGDNLPITNVSREGFDKFMDMFNKSYRQKWRLPTLKEWVFAFKGGIFGEQHRFSGSERHILVAWSKGNSRGVLHPVGERIGNDLGIHDMSGNAAEMVTVGDSIVYVGGSYLDDFDETEKGKVIGYRLGVIDADASTEKEKQEEITPCVVFPVPPPEARGFRLVCHEPLRFNKDCERVYR